MKCVNCDGAPEWVVVCAVLSEQAAAEDTPLHQVLFCPVHVVPWLDESMTSSIMWQAERL